MFEVPGSDVKSVHINSDCVKGQCAPQYTKTSTTNTTNKNDNDQPTTEEEESAKVRVTQ